MGGSTASGRRLDVRLLIGLALVAASVAGVVALVGAGDARVEVYAAGAALTPGERVGRAELVVRSVALDGADALYLRVGDLPADGLVVVQPIRRGELLPRAAVGEASGMRSTALVVALVAAPSSSVRAGSVVDVWASPADASGRGFGAPLVLVPDAVVVRVNADDGVMASRGGGTIEVLVPRSRVARVLQALAAGDALAVVPAGIALGG